MKRYNWWITGILFILMIGCDQSHEKFFDDTASIYFDLEGSQRDSIIYSFSKTVAKEHTIEIPVEIAGYTADYDRHYKVVVDDDRTTAKVGDHYKALESIYTLPAGKFVDTLPIVFYCTDLLLDSVSVYLGVKIEPTEDFMNKTADRQVALIGISNFLQKPSMWEAVYGRKYFGPYSKVKHKLILEICKLEDMPPYNTENRLKMVGYGRVMQNYFEENYPVYDENHQIIEPEWPITY